MFVSNPYPDNPLCKRPRRSGMRQWCRCMECLEYEKMRKSTFTRVKKLDTGIEYELEDKLSEQFTAINQETGKTEFFFWKDKNVEWEEVK